MPLVKIEIEKGHTDAYKSLLLQSVHQALENALGIPRTDNYMRLYELEPALFIHGEKSNRFCLMEITLFPGRSRETKGKIMAEITGLLNDRLGIAAADIFIVLHDPPLENWGLGGVQKG